MGNLNYEILLYVPNVIGYARILLTLTSFVLLGLQLPGWFVIVYAAAIILDGFDGYLARKLGQCSQFGAWLASTVSALEWTVFVCNHQLGNEWRHRVTKGATDLPNSSTGTTSSSHQLVAKPCSASCAKVNEFSTNRFTATTANSYCDQRKAGYGKYQELCEGEYERSHNRSFTKDCMDDFSHQETTTQEELGKSLPTEDSRSKREQENNLEDKSPPRLVQWIMKNNFRSVGGVWAIAGLHVLPLWLVGLRYGVFATSLHFLPSSLPVLGVLVLGAGRLLCGVAELWFIWLHVKALITFTGDKSG